MFFLLCPRVAGEISSSLKYSIDSIYQLHERSEYQLQGHNNATNLNSLV